MKNKITAREIMLEYLFVLGNRKSNFILNEGIIEKELPKFAKSNHNKFYTGNTWTRIFRLVKSFLTDKKAQKIYGIKIIEVEGKWKSWKVVKA